MDAPRREAVQIKPRYTEPSETSDDSSLIHAPPPEIIDDGTVGDNDPDETASIASDAVSSSCSSSTTSNVVSPPGHEELGDDSEPEVVEVIKAPPVAAFQGKFRDFRFSGHNGRLVDHAGREVYFGDWVEGQRWGSGRCIFRDSRGVEWKFDGDFIADEIRKGELTLSDAAELRRLRDSNAAPDRYRIIQFVGTFTLPATMRGTEVMKSLCGARGAGRDFARTASGGARSAPGIAPEFLHRLFAGEGVAVDDAELLPPGSPGPTDTQQREVVIDLRRALSAAGDSEVMGAPLGLALAHAGRARAVRSDSANSADSALDLSAQNALDEYLPHRSKWTRLLDPAAGMQTLEQRIADGLLLFADGCRYRGGLYAGLPHGVGTLTCPSCELIYLGQWREGRPHGAGSLSVGLPDSSDRSQYVGEFEQGLRNGRGVQSTHNGLVTIRANFVNDMPDGEGCIVKVRLPAGTAAAKARSLPGGGMISSYEGSVVSGVFEGPGKLQFSDGTRYEGTFKDGVRHGSGAMYDSSGRPLLIGSWVEDFPEGNVTHMELPDGLIYTGDVKRGQRQGMGEVYNNGVTEYEGLWLNDIPHGRGTFFGPDGSYEGEFRFGKRHGKGLFHFKENPQQNGDPRIYEGDWNNNLPDGIGRYLNDLGIENTYRFKEGVLLETSAKQYKSGVCGRAPALGVPFKVEPAAIAAHDIKHWGARKSLSSRTAKSVLAPGAGLWPSHENKPFEFRSNPGPVDPVLETPPQVPDINTAIEQFSKKN